MGWFASLTSSFTVPRPGTSLVDESLQRAGERIFSRKRLPWLKPDHPPSAVGQMPCAGTKSTAITAGAVDPLSALFGWLTKLTTSALEKKIVLAGEKFATRAQIEGRVKGCIGRIVDGLDAFFRDEKLSEVQRILLVEQCGLELQPLVEKASPLLAGSLDGQKIYDQLYTDRPLPEAIRPEKIEHHYSLLFPRVAHLVCRIPGLVEQWQKEAWAESFRRLDDLADAMGDLTRKVDELMSHPVRVTDELLARIRRALLQRVAFTVDLTGLRGDRPERAAMEQMFVLPEMTALGEHEGPKGRPMGPALRRCCPRRDLPLRAASARAGESRGGPMWACFPEGALTLGAANSNPPTKTLCERSEPILLAAMEKTGLQD